MGGIRRKGGDQGKKYKKQTTRTARQDDKNMELVKDETPKVGKKRGKKKCGGWVGRWGCGEKLIKESIFCTTCHRKFHNTVCHDSHKEYCEIKASKDKEALITWARGIYDKYVDIAGIPKKELLKDKERVWSGVYSTLKWVYRELQEAHDILKKRDEEYFRGDCRPRMGWSIWHHPSRINKCLKCGNGAEQESVPLNGIIYTCVSEKCKNHFHTKERMGDNDAHALELWNKANPSDN